MFDHRWMFDHDAFDHGMMFDHLSRPQDSTDGTTLADVLPRMLVTSFISAVQFNYAFADVPSTRLSYAEYISASPFAVTLGPSSPRPAPLPHTCAQTPASPSPHPPHIHPPTIAAHGPCPRPLAPPGLGGGGAAAGPEECTRAGGRFSCRVGEAGHAQGVGRGGGGGGRRGTCAMEDSRRSLSR